MTEAKSSESQQELFSEFSQEPRRTQRFPSLAKSHKPILFAVTLEQILLTGILLILVMCLVFFLGILRGKSIRPVPTPAGASAVPVRLQTAPPVSTPAVQAVVSVPAESSVLANKPTAVARPRVMVDDPAKPYSIQLVTYKKREYAEKEAGALKRLGFFSTIIQRGDYYEVRVGQYASADDARRDLGYFSAKYKGCFLCRR